MKNLIELGPGVRLALESGKPVVALESTIIAHGMSYPKNVETALAVEDIVRKNGAEPCTIAIIEGVPVAGLTKAQIEHVGKRGHGILKCSTRDIPFALAMKIDGATTVASTARIAAICGISVFATGGIGGVHRGAEKTFDMSADLPELAQSNVAVVTAGAKAILDLALTLETLETMGVPVVGFATSAFPAFYSRDSGLAVPMRLDTVDEIAAMMDAKWSMGLAGGVIVANPIPEAFEIPNAEISPVINAAVAEAKEKGVSGKEVTPFLLARLAELTGGRSLAANIALVENNAAVAARIAVAYARREAR